MTHTISGGRDGGSDDGSGPDDMTRIIRPDIPDEEATRILPLRSPVPPPESPGTKIGVASDPGAAGSDDKTVFLPAGKSMPEKSGFDPAVGWLVIVEGPGRGNHCSVYYGQNSIGRGEDQRIRLNFGDARITRDAHAFIIYDDLAHKFYLRDNGKANLVRLNDTPVMTPTEIEDRDRISLGETVLMFVALCGPDFDWLSGDDGPSTGART